MLQNLSKSFIICVPLDSGVFRRKLFDTDHSLNSGPIEPSVKKPKIYPVDDYKEDLKRPRLLTESSEKSIDGKLFQFVGFTLLNVLDYES